MLLHRGDAAARDEHPGLPRRPARHRDHLRRPRCSTRSTIVGKRIDDVQVVFCGAGAAGIACAEMYVRLGVRRENVLLVDTVGVVYEGRTEKMNPYKAAVRRARPAADAGRRDGRAPTCSSASRRATCSRPTMLRSMDGRPDRVRDGEPGPGDHLRAGVRQTRPDVIMATGPLRLPEPGEQRARLPVHLPRRARRARQRDQRRDEDGRGARARAARARGRARVGAQGLRARPPATSGASTSSRSRSTRACCCGWRRPWRKAAMADGRGADSRSRDLEAYRESLERILGPSREVMHLVMHKAQKQQPRRLVFPEGEDETILRAAHAHRRRRASRGPILLGRPRWSSSNAPRSSASRCTTSTSSTSSDRRTRATYADLLYQLRARKGMTPRRASTRMLDPDHLRADDGARRATPTGSSAASARPYPGDHPPGHPDRRAPRRRVARVGAPPARAEGPAVLLRRHDGQHRSLGRGARGDRVPGGRHRACVRHRAARGDAVVLQLRLGAAPAGRARRGGGRISCVSSGRRS